MHAKSSEWDKHMVEKNFRLRYVANTAKSFLKECAQRLCCVSCLFLSVSFVSSNFHPNQASVSHFILIFLLPQPIIISSLCFSESLFLTLDLYLSLVSLVSRAVSLCLIYFSFPEPCFLKNRAPFSVGVPNKLVPCTFTPHKNFLKNVDKVTHLADITAPFFLFSLTYQILTGGWQVHLCCWLSKTTTT